MNIYHVYQKKVRGYDTYSDFVVVANSEKEARSILPYQDYKREGLVTFDTIHIELDGTCWPTSIKDIKADYIGMAKDSYTEPTIICSSFHAG